MRKFCRNLIPDALVANLKYLNFLVARGELDLAGPVWQRCLNNALPADFEWMPSSTFSYIDHLLARMRVSEALSVWKDVLRKTRSGLSDLRLAAKPSGAADFGSENLFGMAPSSMKFCREA